MYEIILRIHSLTPYLFLIIAVATIGRSIIELPKNTCSRSLKALARVTMVLAHIQLLFGLMLLFFGDRAIAAYKMGMGTLMKNPDLRLAFVEHPLTMIIAVVLFTVGFSRAKKATDNVKKNRTILIFYSIALVLVLIRLPYAAWFNL